VKSLDILVVGSGISALSTAISAKEEGANVLIATKGVPTKNNSVMAQGGINAALGNIEDDNISLHIEDTLKSSHNLANKKMVELLCNEAINAIKFLERVGTAFSRIDNAKTPINSIAQRKLGGASAKRACYAQDYTGLKILHTLLDRAINYNIKIIDGFFLLDLIKNENKEVCGALFYDFNNAKIEQIYAKRVILATGGFGSIYGKNTNSYGSSGDGIAVAFRNEGELSNLEFVQFHPTALKNSNILISESARGEGGYLVNSDNERFVDELQSRDIVAKAIYNQIQKGKRVYLDLRAIGKSRLEKIMPQELKIINLYAGVDASKELVEIAPAVHYTMGGVSVDSNFEIKNLKGCFGVGECSDAKVHGANRLGGNSLLEAVAFGRLSAKMALAKEGSKIETKKIDYKLPIGKDDSFKIFDIKSKLGEILDKSVGIIRDESSLLEAFELIDGFKIANISAGSLEKYNTNLIELFELKNSILLSKALIKSALWRKESRGAHQRSDYPIEKKEFEKSSVITIKEL